MLRGKKQITWGFNKEIFFIILKRETLKLQKTIKTIVICEFSDSAEVHCIKIDCISIYWESVSKT